MVSMFELENMKPAAALGYAILFWHHCDDIIVASAYFLLLAASITSLPEKVRKTASALFVSHFTMFQPGEFSSEWLAYIANVLVLTDQSAEARHFILVAYLLAIPREHPVPAFAHALLAWSAFDIIQSSPPPSPSPGSSPIPAIVPPSLIPTSLSPSPTTVMPISRLPLTRRPQTFPSYVPSFLFRLDSELSTTDGQRL